ncbi:hypothetical protein Glove_417g58 [Diversispora epigaea]|uniref:Cryptic loci regulator 2 N-terminal domain-containing protein n=1 Tax=Diversispora epigaea TaxID=1348612 RepID=A0A397GY53_9GLOM|nr:hypothetical protein Glove_417g58 [Diversispora epigaea]
MSGKKFFRNFVNVIILDDGFTVTRSDANPSMWPDTTPDINSEGVRVYYRPVNSSEAKGQHYLTKLGEALANALCKATPNLRIPKPMLKSFPQGYKLFERIRENHDNLPVRRDTYLFGSHVSLKFYSPREFEEHLLWLASDKESLCNCKYCTKNRQRKETETGATTIMKALSKKRFIDSSQDSPSTESRSTKRPRENVGNGYQKTQNSKKKYNTFRIGEITWVEVRYILDSQNEMIPKQITHWPAFVRDHNQITDLTDEEEISSSEPIIQYDLQILFYKENMRLKQKAILPWLALDSTNFVTEINKIDNDDRTELMSKFLKAIDYANDATSKTLEPFYSEEVISPRLRVIKGILIGPELLKENDYIRVKHDKQQQNAINLNKSPIFKIHYILHNEEIQRIELTGDIFVRVHQDQNVLVKINLSGQEHKIGLGDIAGRFYEKYSDISRCLLIDEYSNNRFQAEFFKEF